MITELELQDKVILGGEKIAVHKSEVRNKHFHELGEIISRLQIAILESDTNNSSGGMVGMDSEDFIGEWERYLMEWDLAKEFRNLDPASTEKIYAILRITDNEELRTNNVRCRRVVRAMSTLLHKMLACDSANHQYQITDRDQRKIESQHAYVSRVLAEYVGAGDRSDLGREVAAFEYTGTIVPPINLHEAIVAEPGPNAPRGASADAPDTPSTVPAPGSRTGRN